VWVKNVTTPSGTRNIPLEPEPSDTGTVAARPFSAMPGRFLARDEQPRAGETRWVNHFDTCPDASSFRKPARTPDPQPALFPPPEGNRTQ
jgi:hypothetical protein